MIDLCNKITVLMKYADDSKLGVVMKRKEDSHIPFLRGRKELGLANQTNGSGVI